MSAQHFDVIWIGTGQATLTVVPRLAAAGKTVAIIEGGKFGGTCVNHGCSCATSTFFAAEVLRLTAPTFGQRTATFSPQRLSGNSPAYVWQNSTTQRRDIDARLQSAQ
jgi:pyruvate/2-oxoglutarate dehydrogenase complex dihydrolipoamide dehydrogenase (E3) component